jgi:hypothetical protein
VEKHELIKILENVQTSFDCVIPLSQLRITFAESLEFFKKALRKGVKIRYITDFPEDESIQKAIQTSREAGHFELRYTLTPPQTILGITDKKALYVTSILSDRTKVRSFCTTSPDLIATFQDYFELKWRSALKGKTQKEKSCLQQDSQLPKKRMHPLRAR